MWDVYGNGMESFGTLDGGEKTIAMPGDGGDRWRNREGI